MLVQVGGDARARDRAWFMPMLKPCALLVSLITRIAVRVNAASSAVSSTVRSV